MKKLLGLALALSALVPATASAGFVDCDILGGQPVSCQNGFEGVAVVDDRGTLRECTFKDGHAVSCGKAFDGRALVRHQGIYQMCEVAEGAVYRCVEWAQGRAPQWQAEDGQEEPDLAAQVKVAAKAPAAKRAAAAKAKGPKAPATRTAATAAKPKDNPS